MTKIDLELHDDVVSTIEKIMGVKDSGVEIEIPEGSVLFDNILNLKLVKNFADKNNINVQFETDDEIGQALIESIDAENIAGSTSLEAANEVISEDLGENYKERERRKNQYNQSQGNSIINLGSLKLPKFKLAFNKTFIILGILLLVFVGLGIFALSGSHRAEVRIIVNSQPLARSVTIRVKKDATTNVDQKMLKGTAVTTDYPATSEIATTGEKQVGNKAAGTVTVYNKTSDEKTFKKGTVLVYDDNTKYTLDDSITIDPKTETTDSEGNITMTPGEETVDVTAINVGKDSNIEKGTTLEVDDNKKSNFEAKAKDDFEGGSSKTVKVVAAADIKTLKDNITKQTKEDLVKALETKAIGSGLKFIAGSETTTLGKETYNFKEGDEAEKVKVVQDITATGLAYSTSDLNSLLDKLAQNLVPAGYAISNKDREVKVDILGNTTNSTLTSIDADLQVSLKTYIVPDITETSVKDSIAGKTSAEAQKIIGGIKDISTYEFKLVPSIPFFTKVPTDKSKIQVDIERK